MEEKQGGAQTGSRALQHEPGESLKGTTPNLL